ncbi:sigma 54-interacting transcriptional regulator [Youngiibacter multivorans]|uniref:Transcriptional regulator with PAS, ATPase and Fis domain n=1 Tax=Youngiibacter multivorans TaxID=937251 RepID=A0ABS4G7Z5_9CLOT|nr:sigma 54-interacting transcriptional regulator [Youngiibacter multivorans]MBP1920654.1 transcriptional regulator with PAS, ATPase and Fis domain [Youngiibacter multivorans]
MIKILFIVPYPELRDIVLDIISERNEVGLYEINVIVSTVDSIPQIDSNNYDVIIARGYSADIISKKYADIPIIKLDISGYDVFRSLYECVESYHPKHIAIIGTPNLKNNDNYLQDVFKCKISILGSVDYSQLEEEVKHIKNTGCDAIIGGYSANLFASKYKLNSVVIKTGVEAISNSLNEAIRTVEILNNERLKAEMYRNITKSSKEAIMFIDKTGIIRVDNSVACLIGNNTKMCGCQLSNIFPFLYDGFIKSIYSEKELLNEIHEIRNRMTVSASFSPVKVGNDVKGVVINMTDISRIQELEGQIRVKLSSKGLKAKYTFTDVIHSSEIMDSTINTSIMYAKSSSSILIIGETGTGKEIFAQSIHNCSNRCNGPFVAVNCAALPENLLESELFGYVDGAFTGSSKGGKMGLFEQAHNGTIFLDEISEIPLALQGKLLRVLQENEVRRIGDDKVISINVRVIAATNRNLKDLVDSGKFRNDLLFRIDILRIYLPSLAEREDDVEKLFLHLLNKYKDDGISEKLTIDSSAMTLLKRHNFTGNIRELMNIVERACVLRKNNCIDSDVMNQALNPKDINVKKTYDQVEQVKKIPEFKSDNDAINWAINESNGNKSKAAMLLGINRTTLWKKLKKIEIEMK